MLDDIAVVEFWESADDKQCLEHGLNLGFGVQFFGQFFQFRLFALPRQNGTKKTFMSALNFDYGQVLILFGIQKVLLIDVLQSLSQLAYFIVETDEIVFVGLLLLTYYQPKLLKVVFGLAKCQRYLELLFVDYLELFFEQLFFDFEFLKAWLAVYDLLLQWLLLQL